jgi:transketolase
VAAALVAAQTATKPTLICCRTVIGYGAPKKQGTHGVHGAPLGAEELAATKAALNWPHGAFELPEEVKARWLEAGRRGSATRKDWEGRVAALDDDAAGMLADALNGFLTPALEKSLADLRAKFETDKPKMATRQSSETVITAITAAQSNLIGGSADLTHSNLTKGKSQKPVTPGDFSGNYIHYGIREHAMGAVMNGLAAHGGFIPYGGTFLVFSDFARPSIRLSALMGLRSIYVMTHDSIGLGEDGPTHQPVEHLPSLRAMPNLAVFRPADALETLDCWTLSLQRRDGPSLHALSRQALPALDRSRARGGVEQGAYVLREAAGARDVTLLATGSEVALAVSAAEALEQEGIRVAVVSMPCFEIFRAQDSAYRKQVLGQAPRIAIEAAGITGWHEWLGDDGQFIGMKGFGASAPADQLYAHFGITQAAIIAAAKTLNRRT